MSIFITGDIHGDPTRLSNRNFEIQKDFEFNSQEKIYVIIAGDFGLVWDYKGESKNERYWLDWLENRNFTTLFIDGNHECFSRLDALPVEEWNGGKVSFVRPHVIHLKRGQVFELEGKKIFTFGGAKSKDIEDGLLEPDDPRIKEWRRDYFRQFRVIGQSWWERELPSKEEMEEGIRNLSLHNNQVDYIITHSPYTSLLTQMSGGLCDSNCLTNYLQNIKQTVDYKRWYFGHMHVDKPYYWEKAICLYDKIEQISYGHDKQCDYDKNDRNYEDEV